MALPRGAVHVLSGPSSGMVSPPNIYPLISTLYPYLGPSSMRAHAPRWGRSVFCCRLLLSGSAPDSPLSWALRPPRTHPQINPSGPTPRLPDVQRCAETGRGPQPRTGFCMRLHIRVAVCGRDTRWRVASPLMWLALRKSAQSRSRLVGAPPYLWRTPPPSSGEGRRRAWAAMRPLAVRQARVE